MRYDSTRYVVLALRSADVSPSAPTWPDGYAATLWRPRAGERTPPGVGGRRFAIWWALHVARLFPNRDYALLLVAHGDALVHRSVVLPRYFAFPFMRADDLQIGDTWTDPSHRGKGLARAAIREIVHRLARPGRTFWYIADEASVASLQVARHAGLADAGGARRSVPLGVRAIGRYERAG